MKGWKTRQTYGEWTIPDYWLYEYVEPQSRVLQSISVQGVALIEFDSSALTNFVLASIDLNCVFRATWQYRTLWIPTNHDHRLHHHHQSLIHLIKVSIFVTDIWGTELWVLQFHSFPLKANLSDTSCFARQTHHIDAVEKAPSLQSGVTSSNLL